MKKLSKKMNRRGFTLVELIVVIAILAILAGVAIPVYSSYISKANEAADLTALDSIKTAVVFAATEKAIPGSATVQTITVSADGTTISYTLKEDGEKPDHASDADILAYTGGAVALLTSIRWPLPGSISTVRPGKQKPWLVMPRRRFRSSTSMPSTGNGCRSARHCWNPPSATMQKRPTNWQRSGPRW